MKIGSILVVCIGNICRSPVGERLLAKHLPKLEVSSAGIGALVGHPADTDAASVAREHGLSLEGHVARQFDPLEAASKDLILVMEPGHRREIGSQHPELMGRTMLFDHWTKAKGIPDPYQKDRNAHLAVFMEINAAAAAWAERLGTGGRKI